MKATGIVRRIDELGRVVIPKEIRRTQRIRRGDPLEIFTTGDGEVIFKKYSPMGEVNTLAAQLAEVLSRQFALTAFVCARDRPPAVSGSGCCSRSPCALRERCCVWAGRGLAWGLRWRGWWVARIWMWGAA